MSKIRCTNFITSRPIELSSYKQSLYIATYPKTNLKGYIVVDGYDNNSSDFNGNGFMSDANFTTISNDFVEVSWIDRKFTLVGFDHDIFNIYIPNGAFTIAVDLTVRGVIGQLKKSLLLNVFANSLISTSQAHYFVMGLEDVDKIHRGKNYIHDG